MQYGIAFIPGMPYRQVLGLAQLAENLGYDYLFIPDQTFHRDPFALLALIAQATQRIHLGLAVTNPYTRHPVQIARAAGLVGEIAEGRFWLGLGAGNRTRVLGSLGIDPAGTEARLREAVTVIRRLLAGETVDYHSPTLTLNHLALDYQPPHRVPIYIASRGRQVLTLGGEVADGVMMEGLFTPGGMEYGLGCIAEGAQRAGRDPAGIQSAAWQAVTLGDDPEMASQERWRNWAGMLIHSTRSSVLRPIGISEATEQVVREDLAAHGEEGVGRRVTPADVIKMVIVGTPTQIQTQVRQVRDSGVSMFASVLLGDYSLVRASMERFAAEVMAPLARERKA